MSIPSFPLLACRHVLILSFALLLLFDCDEAIAEDESAQDRAENASAETTSSGDEIAPGVFIEIDLDGLLDNSIPHSLNSNDRAFLDGQGRRLDEAEVRGNIFGGVEYHFADGAVHQPSWTRHGFAIAGPAGQDREHGESTRRFESTKVGGESTHVTLASHLMPVDCNVAGGPTETRVMNRFGYDYAPSVMFDEGKYKIWWCGDNNYYADKIWYAEADDISIPSTWTLHPTPVLSGSTPSGDGLLTVARLMSHGE